MAVLQGAAEDPPRGRATRGQPARTGRAAACKRHARRVPAGMHGAGAHVTAFGSCSDEVVMGP